MNPDDFEKPDLLTWKQALKAHHVQSRIELMKELKEMGRMKNLEIKHQKLLEKATKHTENIKLKIIKAQANEIVRHTNKDINTAMSMAETSILEKIKSAYD